MTSDSLFHVGDLVIFNYNLSEHVGLIEFVDEDFYGDTIYSVIDSETGKTLFLRQSILRLAYK